jgi:predicted anti-sigma-YlaC factor YlaD
MIRHLYVLLGALSLGGCNLPELSVNLTAPVLAKAADHLSMESDVQLARDAAPASLKTADGFLASAPHNRTLLEVVARGYFEYTFGFVEDDLDALPDDEAHHARRDDETKRATVFYDRAVDYALADLATFDKDIEAAAKKDIAGFEARLAKLPKAAVGGLLYGGMAWASSINLNRSDILRVGELPKAVAMVKRAYALDPTFYNGAAGMTLGLVSASQGKAMGGDPDAAKKYFDAAVAATGGKFLLAKVMEARFLAVQLQDRALFERLLNEVLATPADIMPSQRLPNELAKRRAKRYLAHAEDLF